MNIKDIAKLSGVGVSTVSRVINNHPDVKKDTREKVLEIIKKYNYIPNNTARMLKQNHTSYIGVLVKGVFNPFFSEMVKIISKEIDKSNYAMILHHDDLAISDIDSLIAFSKEKRLKGVIYLGGNFEGVEKEKFKQTECKMVVLCSNIDLLAKNECFSSVGIDDYKSAYKAMEYVINKGHKNIGIIIGGEGDEGVGEKRLKGYFDCIKDNNIPKEYIKVIEGQYEYNQSYFQTLKCIEENKEITVFCAISDIMAVGAAKAITKTGKIIGKDIDIIGFDGMDIAKFYNPSITTIEQPREDIAKKGIKLLIKQLEKNEKEKHIILDTKLLKRESC